MNALERLVLKLASCRGLTWCGLLPAALACLGLCGCASFYDDVTSRDFEIRSLWEPKPDPLVVLSESRDGDKRARAYRALLEPVQYGGSQQQQDLFVKALCTAAVTERTNLCRLAAIATLRNYKDPRVCSGQKESKLGEKDGFPGLIDAYYAADKANYPPETVAILRCQVLEALGQGGHPEAAAFLIKILKEPPLAKGSSEAERQQLLEQRLTAARALGHFKQMEAADTLLTILQKEKDPGMRNVATASLQQETGKRYPEDAVAWEKYLHNAPDKDKVFGEPSFGDKVLDVANVAWWWK